VTDHNPFVFSFGEFEVREREFLLISAREPVAVEPKAFRVLLFLLRNPGRLIRKDEIVNAVWDDCSVSDNSLTRSIATLRRLLCDDSRYPRYIATVPTIGYRFLCPVDVSEEAPGRHTAPDLLKTSRASADEEGRTRGTWSGSEFLDSIAVLPFENVAAEPDMEYLSDGITATIINNLSQLNRLRVVPRTTVFRYKGRTSDVAQAGRELRVRVVLIGQVVQRSDVLIVNVELIEAAHESQLWGASYDTRPEDILSVQAEIAGQITDRLRLRLGEEERRQLAKRPTESREAYYLYLRAMHWANKWTPEGVRKGVDYTRQAIDVDPAYAEAWIALAYMYVLIGSFGSTAPTETFAKAEAAAVKALEIDDSKANAHAILAFVRLMGGWDWQGAFEELLCAKELAPNLASGHYVSSFWYLTQGRFPEATSEAKLALDVDPLSTRFSFHLGQVHYFARQYDQAIEQLKKTNELDPLFARAYQFCALAYAQKGMRDDAIAELEKGNEFAKDDLVSMALRAIADALTGRTLEARNDLDKLRQELQPPHFSSAYYCAVLHALLGEIDEALACLEMARQGHSIVLPYLAIEPNLDNLHDDPRFPDLLRRIGIPVSKT
jgi:TolB-like protein/DNA-binding winged helix-turn-helix (wHTH) protein